jgi:hypothetical protein
MVKQLVLGTILGGIVLFIWSFIAWTFIPWPGEPLLSFTNDEAVVAAIKANAARSGNYLLPNEVKRTAGMTDEQYKAAQQAAMDKMSRGPVIFAAIRLEPFGSMFKALMIKFITQLVAALLASFLLLQTNGLSYPARIVFVTILGLIIFAGANVDEWNWWGFSNAYTAMQLGVTVIGWFLAAFAIAAFVRGKSYVAAP